MYRYLNEDRFSVQIPVPVPDHRIAPGRQGYHSQVLKHCPWVVIEVNS